MKTKGPTQKTMKEWQSVKPDTPVRRGDWVRALRGPGVGPHPDPWETASGLVGQNVDGYDSEDRSVLSGIRVWEVLRRRRGGKK